MTFEEQILAAVANPPQYVVKVKASARSDWLTVTKPVSYWEAAEKLDQARLAVLRGNWADCTLVGVRGG